MSAKTCPNCQYSPLPDGAANCPNCNAEITAKSRKKNRKPKIATKIDVQVDVGQAAAGAVITGVRVEQLTGDLYAGFSASEVRGLLEQISQEFQPRPFSGECPYVGLEPFREQDAQRFFGRERLVSELILRIQESRFLFIAGPSGSGKSSLVRAGLIPALKDGRAPGSREWLYTSMVPGRAPLESLGKAVSVLAGSLQPLNDFRQPVETLAPAALIDWSEVLLGDDQNRRMVLVVDQFEEVFTQLQEQEKSLREAFLQQLTRAAAKQESRLVVLLTLRSDFVSNCAAYPALNALLNQGFFQVGPMSPQELVSAIARPAVQAGLRIEPDLITQVVQDMRQEPGALPLLQFALRDLFDHEQSKGGVMALTLQGYLERGGIHQALARYADDAFGQLSQKEQEMARWIFRGLVQPGRGTQDSRRTALFEELAPAGSDIHQVEAVIRRLADARLLITDERADTPQEDRTATLAHERLLDAWPWLHRLVDENRESIALQVEIEQDAQRWQGSQRDDSYLYTGARLATAQERLAEKQIVLSGSGAAFIQAAVTFRENLENARQQALQAEQRRELEAAQRVAQAERQRAEAESRRTEVQRRLLRIVFGLFLIALALTGWALVSQRAASENARLALRGEKTASSALIESNLRGTEAANQRSEAEKARATADANRLAAETNARLASDNAAEASRQARLAVSRQLASQSLADLLQGSPDTALRLAAHALRIADTPAARSALLTALQDEPRLMHLLRGHTDYVLDLAAQPGGSLLASTGCGQRDLSREKCLYGEVRLWDALTGTAIGEPLTAHKNVVRKAAFSPDGVLLATADDDSSIILWNVKQRTALHPPIQSNLDSVSGLVFSPDSRTLYVLGDSPGVEGWDVQQGQVLSGELFPGLPADLQIRGLQTSLRLLAAASEGGQFEVWDVASAARLAEIQSTGAGVSGFILAPQQPWAAAIQNNDVLIYDAQRGLPISQPLSGHTGQITQLSFTPDGLYLASGGLDQSVRVWNVPSWLAGETGAALPEGLAAAAEKRDYPSLLGHNERITSLTFTRDGLASGSRDTTIRIWDWDAAPSLGVVLHQQEDELLALTYSPPGDFGGSLVFGGCAASVGEDCTQGKINFMAAEIGVLSSTTLLGHTNLVNSLAFSPNGELLASGSWDGSIILWSSATKTMRWGPVKAAEDFITGLAFSPDGSRLASSSRDGTVRIWNTENGSAVGEPLRGSSERLTTVDWSPSGDYLAAAGRDTQVLLWDLNTSPPVSKTLEGHGEQINQVQFSPDGRLLASSSADNTTILWEVATGKMWKRLVGHSDRVTGLIFLEEGKMLATSSWDRTIRLWDVESGQLIGRPMTGHADAVGALAGGLISPYLYSAGRDGTILRWEINPQIWRERACRIAALDFSPAEWSAYVGAEIPFEPACP